MNEKIVFFTPSYRVDFERFVLLRESIKRFYNGKARHIVVVPRADEKLFKSLKDDVETIRQNDFVPSYFYPCKYHQLLNKIMPQQMWRFGGYTRNSGWFCQQICKLSIPEMVANEAVIVIDSDCIFMKPFNNLDLTFVNDKRILFRTEQDGVHSKWMKETGSALNLPHVNTQQHYIAHPVVWYPDWVRELRKYLESLYGMPWQKAFLEKHYNSEFCLYGVFVSEILKPRDLLVCKPITCFGIWFREEYESRFIHISSLDTLPLIMVVQSNIGVPVKEYRNKLENLWNKAKNIND